MKYLITGVAGSGKTTVANEFISRGYNAYDMDTVPGLCSWQELSTGQTVERNPEPSVEWFEKYNWSWNEKKVREILNQRESIFLCGFGANQDKFYALFTKVFLLTGDVNTLFQRISNRPTDELDFGKHPGERAIILKKRAELSRDLAKLGALEIDSVRPIAEVVDEILAHLK
jgi:adenylate kinase family enzyme